MQVYASMFIVKLFNARLNVDKKLFASLEIVINMIKIQSHSVYSSFHLNVHVRALALIKAVRIDNL